MLRYRFLLVILLAVVLISPLQAATINVPGDQPTIQNAIDAAVSGVDEVAVRMSTFLGSRQTLDLTPSEEVLISIKLS